MKNIRLFASIQLIGFGLYFYLQQHPVSMLSPYISWPTILIIVGVGFLAQSYGSNDHEAILPGVIFTGIGVHFHVVNHLTIWPNNVGVIILVVALGLFLRHQRTGNGLGYGLLFLIFSILLLFYDKLFSGFGLAANNMPSLIKYWPLAIIILGIITLFMKKK